MLIRYLIRFFAKIFGLLIIPTVLCILFDVSTGLITITAGTIIFMIAGYVTFTITDIFMSRGKEDDQVLEDINYWLSPIEWMKGF